MYLQNGPVWNSGDPSSHPGTGTSRKAHDCNEDVIEIRVSKPYHHNFIIRNRNSLRKVTYSLSLAGKEWLTNRLSYLAWVSISHPLGSASPTQFCLIPKLLAFVERFLGECITRSSWSYWLKFIQHVLKQRCRRLPESETLLWAARRDAHWQMKQVADCRLASTECWYSGIVKNSFQS